MFLGDFTFNGISLTDAEQFQKKDTLSYKIPHLSSLVLNRAISKYYYKNIIPNCIKKRCCSTIKLYHFCTPLTMQPIVNQRLFTSCIGK